MKYFNSIGVFSFRHSWLRNLIVSVSLKLYKKRLEAVCKTAPAIIMILKAKRSGANLIL